MPFIHTSQISLLTKRRGTLWEPDPKLEEIHTPGGRPHADTEPLVAADAQRLQTASDDGSDREGDEADAPARGTPRTADASGMSPPQRPASAHDGVVSPSRTDGSDDLELHTRGTGSDSPSDQPSSSDAAGGEQ